MTTVLLVEDDEDVAGTLQRVLKKEGYSVEWVATGQEAVTTALGSRPDVVVLDLGLPDMDGLDVCQELREQGYDGGILMVTARADELDRVLGLDYGADDYLAKPYGVAEMQARVRALARRSARRTPVGAPGSAPAPDATPAEAPAAAPAPVLGGVLRVDVPARRVWVDDEEVALTPKEFDVLALLHAEPGAVVSRDDLMTQVWDEHWFGSTKTLDVTVGRLRHKLTTAASTTEVVTVRGVGFRLENG
ncbi:MAG: response regulator transcription factor [Nocardioides sp.]|nr:response regulator transcription factor [Nocardioides sp.]